MMEKHNADGDGKLTLTEYISDPYRELDKEDEVLRGHKFRGILDNRVFSYCTWAKSELGHPPNPSVLTHN